MSTTAWLYTVLLMHQQIVGANDKNGSGENHPFNHSGDERKAVISGTSEAQWKVQLKHLMF